ncbi:hypothetical protein TBLA_0C02140 [Henningerozyma blattae CBS 6284]|uniref:Uncharacterized protein n=1 Tax=Henningerozyma blattae (strain ATCC 34711 / CBS 6284 / DSM 70876 / NBRC 10599 / NRRL Y-10934 / UCD 77-7) TaxID=1071380 RepID=I2H0X4_HENB6|nr:hypothetical protein TBLA_0C02140 [Tetrapisispora blattae CBS 6284]CCH60026.1 hypothetical protein TBLA_0C02140 [Tetrapisispora blattae CBS 6284]
MSSNLHNDVENESEEYGEVFKFEPDERFVTPPNHVDSNGRTIENEMNGCVMQLPEEELLLVPGSDRLESIMQANEELDRSINEMSGYQRVIESKFCSRELTEAEKQDVRRFDSNEKNINQMTEDVKTAKNIRFKRWIDRKFGDLKSRRRKDIGGPEEEPIEEPMDPPNEGPVEESEAHDKITLDPNNPAPLPVHELAQPTSDAESIISESSNEFLAKTREKYETMSPLTSKNGLFKSYSAKFKEMANSQMFKNKKKKDITYPQLVGGLDSPDDSHSSSGYSGSDVENDKKKSLRNLFATMKLGKVDEKRGRTRERRQAKAGAKREQPPEVNQESSSEATLEATPEAMPKEISEDPQKQIQELAQPQIQSQDQKQGEDVSQEPSQDIPPTTKQDSRTDTKYDSCAETKQDVHVDETGNIQDDETDPLTVSTASPIYQNKVS